MHITGVYIYGLCLLLQCPTDSEIYDANESFIRVLSDVNHITAITFIGVIQFSENYHAISRLTIIGRLVKCCFIEIAGTGTKKINLKSNVCHWISSMSNLTFHQKLSLSFNRYKRSCNDGCNVSILTKCN